MTLNGLRRDGGRKAPGAALTWGRDIGEAQAVFLTKKIFKNNNSTINSEE